MDDPAEPSADPLPTPAPKPKRRLLQLHLSTAFVTMLAAAILLGLNLRPASHRGSNGVQLDTYGWPWPAAMQVERIPPNALEVQIEFFGVYKTAELGERHVAPWKVVADAGLSLSILLFVTLAFEWPIRRDEAEKALRRGKRTGKPAMDSVQAEAPRKRYRLSLLSMVIVPVGAIILLTMNLVPQIEHRGVRKISHFGWPVAAVAKDEIENRLARNYALVVGPQLGGGPIEAWELEWDELLCDAASMPLILLFLTLLCEWAARRASTAKPRSLKIARSANSK